MSFARGQSPSGFIFRPSVSVFQNGKPSFGPYRERSVGMFCCVIETGCPLDQDGLQLMVAEAEHAHLRHSCMET
jgi:hypothetical protein